MNSLDFQSQHEASTAPASIRRPRVEDWPRILEILRSANFHRIGGSEMPQFPLEDCFVADLGDRVAGVAGYRILDATTAKTTLLTVDPAFRGRGIGTLLQHTRMNYLRQQGIKTLYTNCDDPAVIAWNIRLFGFRPTGKRIPKTGPYGRKEADAWTHLKADLCT